MLAERRYAIWHRSLGYGGPTAWTLITSYNNKPLVFPTEQEALDFIRDGLDTLRYEFAVEPVWFVVPPAV